ncbi:MAG: TonB-dependent receptor plug domain-containing protein [Bacteroides sp.]|uniref:TonB-dependent receptor plug domain-containing protein n=1 Tax=Bacteroides sp. TaxID=29523 RepID=UPI0026E10D55|nr:TonB-dependent receptor plug domain-containing protein [Bacteroides sp.]MDO5418721.1 TonB-dependent receptor plug domain-containing protein [Bacteroides sp.]
MKWKIIFLITGGLLFVQASVAQKSVTDTVRLTFNIDSVGLDEVVVRGKKTPAANSRWSDMHPVELVTVGGANGDLYKALQTLPGTQVQGETGELLVRGGSSYETQTFIDGMHVLNPYTSNGINTPSRSRYSTFMFSGVNLASGGAPQEYGEALSAVLPLETKDYSKVDKVGVNASVVGVGGGGTKTLDRGSLSVDLNYQNLGLYDKVYSGRTDFEQPYRMFSGATQFRHTPGDATVFKVYAQYDRTDFSAYEGDERRLFALTEDNIYVNATFRYRAAGGWDWFAGAAYSYYNREVGGAAVSGDNWLERQRELHLKTKMSKRFSSVFRLDMGVESYIRNYRNHYLYSSMDDANQMSPTISAGFFSAAYYPVERLKAELSFRTEYTSPNRKINFSPRLAVNYYWGDVMLSGIVGRYTQLPENDWLVRSRKLMSEACMQYNLGMQYGYEGRFYKAELYYKDYNRLVLEETDTETGSVLLTSGGYGYSRGIDLFFRDRVSIKNLEYQLSYTYNISKRKYQRCSELTTPQYATRHNAALVVKYSLPRLHSIISLTNRFSTGRPYHNPLLPGLMNDEVKPYNSLDVGVTFLASKKVIIHASASNILGRKNEFGKVDNKAVLASKDHFFYVGVYVTLGKKAAYDVSNF